MAKASVRPRLDPQSVTRELHEIVAGQLKANAREDAAEYARFAQAGGDLAERIWQSKVQAWADVEMRTALVEYFYIDWGNSHHANRAVVELLLAFKIMRNHEARQVSVSFWRARDLSTKRRCSSRRLVERTPSRESRRGQA